MVQPGDFAFSLCNMACVFSQINDTLLQHCCERHSTLQCRQVAALKVSLGVTWELDRLRVGRRNLCFNKPAGDSATADVEERTLQMF